MYLKIMGELPIVAMMLWKSFWTAVIWCGALHLNEIVIAATIESWCQVLLVSSELELEMLSTLPLLVWNKN